MHLVQILLPLRGPDGAAFPHAQYTQVARELTDSFGGMTAYSRAPATGLWQEEDGGDTEHDDIVVYEVMVDRLDAEWWTTYRKDLERRFHQQELVVRAQEMKRL
ncbi:MAG TPA: hypothetical protein VM051_00820 [Usitatibacter sp.]|nr:hypothetical protein [Usitatibacter sp.]